MDNNDIDFRDMLLEVETEAQQLLEEVVNELQLPMMKQALRVRWATMPDELKEQLLEEQPELYQQIMRMIETERNY